MEDVLEDCAGKGGAGLCFETYMGIAAAGLF
jgi:hypothetical protein